MMRRRRPILRTAVVGGVAYSAGSHVAKASAAQAQQEDMQNAQIAELQQQQQDMQQQAAPPPVYQQPAPPPPPQEAAAPESPGAMNADKIEQLKQIGELHASGVLNDDEFESMKQKILSSF